MSTDPTPGPPWSVDAVADVQAGVYDAQTTARLRSLIAEDPQAAAMLRALDATVDELSLLPPLVMPEQYALRLDVAIAAEATARGHGRTTVVATGGFASMLAPGAAPAPRRAALHRSRRDHPAGRSTGRARHPATRSVRGRRPVVPDGPGTAPTAKGAAHPTRAAGRRSAPVGAGRTHCGRSGRSAAALGGRQRDRDCPTASPLSTPIGPDGGAGSAAASRWPRPPRRSP